MASVPQKNSKPEIALRKAIFKHGVRYTIHDASLPGTPDIVFPKYKSVVFVHGCFWHRHLGCKLSTTPKNQAGFWQEKFSKNVVRDSKKSRQLRHLGWNVMTVWQCEVQRSADAAAAKVIKFLKRATSSARA